MNQSEFETNICHWYQARENAYEPVTIGVGLASHWLEKNGVNRIFPSCFEPYCESEAKCKVFYYEKQFHSYANKTNFHMKSFVLCLAFIMRHTTTRKWTILLNNHRAQSKVELLWTEL